MKRATLLLGIAVLFGSYSFGQSTLPPFLDDTTLCRPNGKAKPPCIKTPPKAKETPSPNYAKDDRKKHPHDVISVVALIGEDGRVKAAAVKKGVTPEMDREALDTVKRWYFEPARMDDGTAVAVRVLINLIPPGTTG